MNIVRYRYLVFSILGAAYILVYFHRIAPAVVAVDMMKDLKCSGALMGILASAYFYSYALMQIPAGLLSDSWGPKRSIAFFFVFGAAGSIALGFSQSVGMAIVSRIVVGMGVAMVFIPTLKILTNWFEQEQFVRMIGILMSLGGVGAYTASAPLALLSDAITWRGSMIVVGVLTMFITVLVWLLVHDTPEKSGFQPPKGIQKVNKDEGRIGLWRGIIIVLGTFMFWPVATCIFFTCIVTLSFNGLWSGPFLMHVYGMSRTQAGAILSTVAIGTIVGSPVMSWFSNRVFHSRKKVLILGQLGCLSMFTLLTFFTGDFSETQLYIWFFLCNFFASSMAVAGYSAIKESFPTGISGTAMGILNIFPFGAAALGQPLIGWYLDSMGSVGGQYTVAAYSAMFKFCLISLFASLIASLLVRESFPKRQLLLNIALHGRSIE